MVLLKCTYTDPPCTRGLLSSDAFKDKTLEANIYGVTRREREQRIFPDVHFTCSGNLTKWIVGGETGNNLGAELQIWRRSNGGQNSYTKIGFSVIPTSVSDNNHVYEYIPNPPLEFQEGDILGVYQRNGENRTGVYYQETTGPRNYRPPSNSNDVDPPAPDTLITVTLVSSQYDYPLVTVEIGEQLLNLLLLLLYRCIHCTYNYHPIVYA